MFELTMSTDTTTQAKAPHASPMSFLFLCKFSPY